MVSVHLKYLYFFTDFFENNEIDRADFPSIGILCQARFYQSLYKPKKDINAESVRGAKNGTYKRF